MSIFLFKMPDDIGICWIGWYADNNDNKAMFASSIPKLHFDILFLKNFVEIFWLELWLCGIFTGSWEIFRID